MSWILNFSSSSTFDHNYFNTYKALLILTDSGRQTGTASPPVHIAAVAPVDPLSSPLAVCHLILKVEGTAPWTPKPTIRAQHIRMDRQTDWRGQNVRQRTYWTCMVGFGQLKQGQAHSGWGWGRQAPTGQPSFLEGQRSRSSRIITHLFMLIFQTIFIINQLAIKFCIVFLPGCILRNKMNINKNNAFVLYSLDIYAGNSKLFYECNLKINKC